MPWKHIPTPILSRPSRQDFLILAASLLIGVIVITFFVLRA